MRRPAALVALLLAAGCGSGPPPQAGPAGPPSAAASPADGRVTGVLDGTELRLEVADSPQERSVGLMGRTEVPAGTGMVFLYDAPTEGRFYMYRVPVPLRATFVRAGRVVASVVMPPCPLEDPAACPTYGPAVPFDTVVETAADAAPRPGPGAAFALRP